MDVGGRRWTTVDDGRRRWSPRPPSPDVVDVHLLMKVADGRLTFFDGPNHEADLQASIELVNDHTFTLNDGDQNLGGTETFTFRIEGDRLTVRIRGEDEWSGTAFEQAPIVRVS
jgi:hypothetical protein